MGPDLFGKNWAWTHLYEPVIRFAAGLGAAPGEPDPDRYARYFDHCDVLIVGAGPAGLAAALAASAQRRAASSSATKTPRLGGSLLAETRARDRRPRRASDWLADALGRACARRRTCG